RNQVIAAHVQRMETQLAATQSVLASLRSLLMRPPTPITVSHRLVNAVLAVADMPPAGPRAALYSADFFELEAGEVTAYVPVSGEVPGSGRAAMVDIPSAELAVAIHRGSLTDLDQTSGALGTYVAEREIGADGPIREHFLVGEFDTDDEHNYVTEVCWPVFQPTPPS